MYCIEGGLKLIINQQEPNVDQPTSVDGNMKCGYKALRKKPNRKDTAMSKSKNTFANFESQVSFDLPPPPDTPPPDLPVPDATLGMIKEDSKDDGNDFEILDPPEIGSGDDDFEDIPKPNFGKIFGGASK